MTEPIINCENINVTYSYSEYRYSTFKEYVMQMLRKTNHKQVVRALQGVNIRVNPGESVALMGHNGSGKSTLLKVIAGIIIPDDSKIEVRGRVAPMIELGTGFDGELSGYENIHLSCSLMGLTKKEIKARIDDIIAFAELEQYIDMPLKNYSSGMQARLGFACTTAVDPNLVLVDEVLAVGDQNFTKKCLQRIYELQAQGCTVILVSHDTNTVRTFCDRALVLSEGKVMFDGDIEAACDVHDDIMDKRILERLNEEERAEFIRKRALDRDSSAKAIGRATETPDVSVEMQIQQGDAIVEEPDFAQPFAIKFSLKVEKGERFRPEVSFGIGINRADDHARVGGTNNIEFKKIFPLEQLQTAERMEATFEFKDGMPDLQGGEYEIWLGLHDTNLTRTVYCENVESVTAANSRFGFNPDKDILKVSEYVSNITVETDVEELRQTTPVAAKPVEQLS